VKEGGTEKNFYLSDPIKVREMPPRHFTSFSS